VWVGGKGRGEGDFKRGYAQRYKMLIVHTDDDELPVLRAHQPAVVAGMAHTTLLVLGIIA